MAAGGSVRSQRGAAAAKPRRRGVGRKTSSSSAAGKEQLRRHTINPYMEPDGRDEVPPTLAVAKRREIENLRRTPEERLEKRLDAHSQLGIQRKRSMIQPVDVGLL